MSLDPHRPDFALVRHLRDRSETRQQHARAARAGTEVRVGRGAYVAREIWDGMDARARHMLRMGAFAATRERPPVFSHWSAAVAHGLPTLAPPPDALHITVGRSSGGRSAPGVVAHSTVVADDQIVEIAGLLCTSQERTAIDISATTGMADGVVITDHLLRSRGVDGGVLGAEDPLVIAWRLAQPLRGHRRAEEAIAFADGRAASPLESVSRVSMHRIGVPQPDLQTAFADGSGRIGFVDFAWPEYGVVGEADGDAKYLDARFRGGRTADRVVLDEKVREDRLRALGLRVARWRWATACNPGSLGAALAAAGLPIDPSMRWDTAVG